MEEHIVVVYFRLLFVAALVAATQAVLSPEDFPNLLAGSFTDGNRFSTGNTLPLVGLPWGFNHWAPQTRDRGRHTGSWWFNGNDHTLTWLRCTHQPSPWIGDWGYFLFSPMLGSIERSPTHFWEPRGATLRPYLLDSMLSPHNMRVELSPSMHGAVLRVTFPAVREQKHICFANMGWGEQGKDKNVQYFYGRTTEVHSDRMLVNRFAFHLRAESADAVSINSREDMRCFQFSDAAEQVTVRMATSLISPQQAAVALQRELGGKSFETVVQESKAVWNKLLRRINVLDAGGLTSLSARHLTVFYTGLYRALTFPRKLEEENERGEIVHYSPYDPSGGTFKGPLVTDNGFWDTFRTVYPLLSIAYPEELGDIIQGWLNAYAEGGWLPSWASPGYRNCMVGTFADVVVADAIVKKIPRFNIDQAVAAMLKDSYEEAPRFVGGAVGKEGLREYESRGYLSTESGGEVVSRTLDYGYADFSIAVALKFLSLADSNYNGKLNKQELANKASDLFERSQRGFTALFDKSRGLMVPRDRSGRASPRFDPLEWGNGFTEGNSWHHSFPPYAVSCAIEDEFLHTTLSFDTCKGGLLALHGGREKLREKLVQLLETKSHFRVGSYGQEIHEMTEARAFSLGQYAHNNQPSHHLLFLFSLLEDSPSTQKHVRYVLQRGFGEDFFAGDEDNGEQGAWFVLSALGLYPVTVGLPSYVLTSPIFPHVRVERVINGKSTYFDIFAHGTSEETVHFDDVFFNGKRVSSAVNTFSDELLSRGGVLSFIMQEKQRPSLETVEQRRVEMEQLHAMKTAEIESSEGKKALPVIETPTKAKVASSSSSEVERLSAHIRSLEMQLQSQANAVLEREAASSSLLPSPLVIVLVAALVAAFLVTYVVEGLRKRQKARANRTDQRPNGSSSAKEKSGSLTQRSIKSNFLNV